MKDIVDTAVEAGSFKTLVTAVRAAGLVEALKGQGPFTVFAPTDSAFSALPAGTVEALLKDIPKLKSILLYHVVAGKVMSSQAMQLAQSQSPAKVKTLQGSEITLKVEGLISKSLQVNNAKVVKADIEATNGVIHVIDKVILPP
ncbi:MAG: fasciclin domain-containing protein [Thermoprotei archaeon]